MYLYGWHGHKEGGENSHLSARSVTVVGKENAMARYQVQGSATYLKYWLLLKGISVLGVIAQHLQVGELLTGSWLCVYGFNMRVEKKLGGNDPYVGCLQRGVQLPHLEKNERGDSLEREFLAWNMCLTLIIKSLKKVHYWNTHPSCMHAFIHIIHSFILFIFLFIHSSKCWQIVCSFYC